MKLANFARNELRKRLNVNEKSVSSEFVSNETELGAGDGIPSATPWHSGPISIPGPTLKPTTREQPRGRLQETMTSKMINLALAA